MRPYSHSFSDDEKLYKTPAEREDEAARDPLKRFAEFLRAQRLATDADLSAMLAEVEARDQRGRAGARCTRRSRRKDTAALWVYSPDVDPTSAAFDTPARPEGKPDTMVAAINRTLKDEMARNPAHRRLRRGRGGRQPARKRSAIVPGKGGVFKLTHGLQRLFGDDRVFNSPLAEAGIIGRAIGMAMRGLKPVVEIQFFDYIWPAMMQMRDEMSMLRYRSGNHFSCPMVVRVPIGGYLKGGGRTTASRARASSRTAPASASRFRRTPPTRPVCCARRSAATTRCCSSSTSTCTGRRTTRASIPAKTS